MRKSVLLSASIALALLLAGGVTLTVRTQPAQAAFPGTNGKSVFVEHNQEEDDHGIKLVNPNGSGVTTLVRCPGRNMFCAGFPSMSPDGMRVAYARGGGTNAEIYKINISNRRVTQITDNKVFDGNPTWSPDGSRIAFERAHTVGGAKDIDIFVRRVDGRGQAVNLTNTPDEDDLEPAWSPNGEEIVFSIGYQDIIVLNLQTGQRRNLTDDGTAHRDYTPSWSPDGTRIVFQSRTDEGPPDYYESDRIITMEASDGSDRRLLATVRHDDSGETGSFFAGATYSPDGKQIAYVRTTVNSLDPIENDHYSNSWLFRMNASDGSDKQLVYRAYNAPPGDRYLYGLEVRLATPDWGVKVQP